MREATRGWLLMLVVCAPAALAQSPEQDILGTPPPEDAKPETPAETKNGPETFGALLSSFNVQAELAGYGEILFELQRGEPSAFEAAVNPIINARMGDNLSAEVEIEIEPDEIAAEYIIVDLSPSPAFTVRVGKFLVPFGEFNELLHPTFRWPMATRPLMMNEVLPEIWNDVGVQLRGKIPLGPGALFRYAGYVANGLGGDDGFTTADEVVRGLREQIGDNNTDKAVGAQVAVELLRGNFGETRIGLSGHSGAVDPRAIQRLSFLGVDATVLLGPVTLRGEAAQSFLGPDADPLQRFEAGAYGQLTVKLARVEPSLRYDVVSLRPNGGAELIRQELAVALNWHVVEFLSVRAEADLPLASTEGRPARFMSMAVFSF